VDTPVPPSGPATDGTRTASTPTILYRRPNAQNSTTPETPASPETLIALETAPPTTMPAIPEISDYWPDAPYRRTAQKDGTTRISHHPHFRADEPGGTATMTVAPVRPAPPVAAAEPRRRRRLPWRTILAALLLAGTGLIGTRLVPYFSASDSTEASTPTQPATTRPSAAATNPAPPPPSPSVSPSTPTTSNTISAPANARSTQSFELVSNATAVNLRAADIGTDLYRITTPTNSARPQVKATDAGIRLFLVASAGHTDTTVEILLNSDIRWSLTITGGAKTSVLNLADTTVSSVNLNGGATRIDLTLPRPKGTLPVRMSGGANQLRIRTAGTIPVRVRIRKGAGKVVLNGQTDNGVARGTSFTSRDFAGSTDRIDVDAVAGVGTLTVGPT